MDCDRAVWLVLSGTFGARTTYVYVGLVRGAYFQFSSGRCDLIRKERSK
jgi:hypothetical protein